MHACKTLETPQGVNLSPSCDTNFWAIPFTPNIIQVHVFLWNNYNYGLRQLWRINDLSYIGLHWTNYEIGWGIRENTTICMYVKELYIKDTFTFKKTMEDQCEELLDLEQPFSPWLACIMVAWCIKMWEFWFCNLFKL